MCCCHRHVLRRHQHGERLQGRGAAPQRVPGRERQQRVRDRGEDPRVRTRRQEELRRGHPGRQVSCGETLFSLFPEAVIFVFIILLVATNINGFGKCNSPLCPTKRKILGAIYKSLEVDVPHPTHLV